MMTTLRHQWSEPNRFLRKTERFCPRCGLVKVTRHEGERHWIEWWRDLAPRGQDPDIQRIKSARTPACVAVEVRAA